jgi:outer membrane protein
MKKYCLLISVFIMILSILLNSPQAIAAEKIGFVDIREIIAKSDAGKKASEQIKILYEKDRIKIQDKESELKKLKDEIEKQRTILTEIAIKEKETAFQKKFRDYQLMVKDINDELQAREQELSKKLIPEILKVTNAIGEREKYTLIMDAASLPIPYYTKDKDLSKQVTQELNKKYKPDN